MNSSSPSDEAPLDVETGTQNPSIATKPTKTTRRSVEVPLTTSFPGGNDASGRLWTTPWTASPEFSEKIVDIVRPAVLDDVRSMSKGRVVWRNVATASETMGRLSTAASTVLAFAGASEIAGQDSSRILGFVAGGVGTLGLVFGSLANFARTQSIERSDAINLILRQADIESIPDINATLVINDDDP